MQSSDELSSETSKHRGESTAQADSASTDLATSMSQVGELAESNAASSEQVSANAEEVTAQVSEMNSQAAALGALVNELAEFPTWIGVIDASQARSAGATASGATWEIV